MGKRQSGKQESSKKENLNNKTMKPITIRVRESRGNSCGCDAPNKFKAHKMYSKEGKVTNVKTKAEHLKQKKQGDTHTPLAKKDACYDKVASRYKGGNSAYRSGAMVKCRKVGAANWGNSSK